jgi:uncharacterized membrane protein YeaQ/YmgE (transglycosylase-associated protein family)
MVFLVIWIICGLIGWAVGNSKGRPKFGFTTGFLLGLIGVVIVVFSRSASELDAHSATYWDKAKA